MSQLRKICLSLPEAYEEETWGAPTFRVRKRIFASHDPTRPSVSLKVTREEQQALLDHGDPFFLPPYVGSKGWVGVELRSRRLDWDELKELITESYRLVAPKRLSVRVD